MRRFLCLLTLIAFSNLFLLNIKSEDLIIESDNDSIEKVEYKDIKNDNNDFKEYITEIIKKYENTTDGDLGVSFYNLDSDVYVGVNDDYIFVAGSTIKVPIAMIICNLIDNNELSLDNVLYYSYSDYEEGSGVMQNMNLNRGFTIEELVENMIVHSDNIATNMIIKYLGYTNMKKEIGDMINEDISLTDNTITTKQSFKILKILYEKSDESESYNWLISLMKNTTFHDRIDNKLPQEMVAHKIGDYEEYIHDIAIIYSQAPYILTVYTKDIYGAKELISNLALDINIANNYGY